MAIVAAVLVVVTLVAMTSGRVPAVLALIVALLVAGVITAAQPAWGGDRTPVPVLQKAGSGTQCVEPADVMRRNHMRFLEHQRDATVHSGIRGTTHSLKGCIDCHASRTTGSVATGPGDFCVGCHAYAAVKIDCFDCHATKPAKEAAR